jgi:hypothetical protein
VVQAILELVAIHNGECVLVDTERDEIVSGSGRRKRDNIENIYGRAVQDETRDCKYEKHVVGAYDLLPACDSL